MTSSKSHTMAAKAAMDAARLAAVMVRVHGPVSALRN